MKLTTCFIIMILLCFLIILYLVSRLRRVREQITLIQEALSEIKGGNLNRRILARENDMTKQICYDINEIAIENQVRLIQQRQSEQSYKRLMTSLSHDVKTPLASLVGYLEAIENGLVVDDEKEEYMHVVCDKAYRLKDFVVSLFEWVKLDSKEQVFHFEKTDIYELSRDIIADWIPVLENSGISYKIEIPDTECMVNIGAYTRIINNLLQNIMVHSSASKVEFSIVEKEQKVNILVEDNGCGISCEELPHIFERMYQCDHSRGAKGNGLGLSITKELVEAHKGTIRVVSKQKKGTTFYIMFSKVLQ